VEPVLKEVREMTAPLTFASRYADRHPGAAARALLRLPAVSVARFLGDVSPEQRLAILQAMGPVDAAPYLLALPTEIQQNVLRGMPLEFLASMARSVSEEDRHVVLRGLPESASRRVSRALQYDVATAGGLADLDPPSVLERHTVEEASRISLRYASRYPYLYVTDRENRLVGVTSRRDLGRATSDATVGAIMQRDVLRISAFESADYLGAHPVWQELDVVPVVDGAGVLVGALRHKTLRRHTAKRPQHGATEAPGARGVVALGTAYCDLLARGLVSLTAGTLAASADAAKGATP
jgi:Mg/Co/Ni transporter MgtE